MESEIVDEEGDQERAGIFQALKKKEVREYYLWGVQIAVLGLGAIGQVAQASASVCDTAAFAVMVTGVMSVSNGVSRMLFGVFYDIWGRAVTMRLIDGCMTFGVIFVCLALYGSYAWMFVVAVILFGMGYGGSVPCNSSYARDYFSDKNFSGVFGLFCSDGLPGAIIGPTIMSVIFTLTGKYLYSYLLFLIFCAGLWIMEIKISKNQSKIK